MDNEPSSKSKVKFVPASLPEIEGGVLDVMPGDQFSIDIELAAKRCGVTPKWIRRAIKSGDLEAIQEPRGSLWQYFTSANALTRWQLRSKKLPGLGAQRAQYVINIDADEEFYTWLFEGLNFWHDEKGLDVSLKRGNKYLIGGPNES